MIADPAVTAAAKALAAHYLGVTEPVEPIDIATVATRYARPIIEAEVRERIAADIEALPPHVVLSRRAAAQIARGTA